MASQHCVRGRPRCAYHARPCRTRRLRFDATHGKMGREAWHRDFPDLSGSTDASVHPAFTGRGEPSPRRFTLVTCARLSLFYCPFFRLADDGLFKAIPKDLEEAAMVDGYSRLGAFFRVVVPISLAGILTVAIFSFTLVMQEFVYAVTFISSVRNMTVRRGRTHFPDSRRRILLGIPHGRLFHRQCSRCHSVQFFRRSFHRRLHHGRYQVVVPHDLGKLWYLTRRMPEARNPVHSSKKLLSANIGQCFHQRWDIAHLQFKSLFVPRCMAIEDKNATLIGVICSFTNVHYSFPGDSMIPTERLRQKHQVKWKMRTHV